MTADDTTTLTGEDVTLLQRFRALAAEVADLLRGETEAIARGDDAAVAALGDRKTDLVARLEDIHPAVAPLVETGAAAGDTDLRADLAALRDAVAANAAAVGRRAAAADTVLAELEKIRDRFGLSGLYEKSGQKRGGTPARGRIDRET